MAKDRQPVRAEAKGTVRVSGRYFPAGAGAITVPTGLNVGWTVARSGVGIHVVTFVEKYAKIVSLDSVQAQLASDADWGCIFGGFTPATATTPATIAITTKLAGVLTDMAANADNSVSFSITFSEAASIK